MDPLRSHRLVHVINNCEGQYNTNSNICFLVFTWDLWSNRYSYRY